MNKFLAFILFLALASPALADGPLDYRYGPGAAPSSGSAPGGVTGSVQLNAGGGAFSGLAPINGDCLVGSGGNWTVGSCSTGSGTVTSVGLSDGSTTPIFNISGSPVTTTGTLAFTFKTQSANTFLGGPSSGVAAQPGFRTLVGADLPNPSATTLGGIESIAGTTHQWIDSISILGVPHQSQPGVGDLSGFGTGVATALAVNVGSAGAFVAFNGALGTPSSGTLTNATGLPISTGVSGLGTGVATALGVNVGSAGAFVTFNGALGTPSSATLTNATGTASGLTAGHVTTNANLTGDVTSVGNATTLATVNSNVGSFTCANATANAKGLITAMSNGGCLLLSGGTMTGELITKASATGGAGLNIPPGTAPTSPVNGDCWTTTLGLYCQINGSTVGPYGTGGGATGANPTATAGPTAINGSSSNFMRADAAPAIQLGSNSQKGIVQVDGQTISAASGIISVTAPDNTKTTSYTIAAGDMGGQVNFNGSSLTVTIPAISSTVLAAGMSVTITNINSSPLTISSTPTINGFSGTTIAQYGWISCVSNGTSLDCVGGTGVTLGTAALAATGTSGHMLPYLDGTNTWSGTQTFGSVVGSINAQSGTTYTLAASDCGKTVVITNASAITLTTLNSLPIGCSIAVEQGGAGQITVSAGSGTTQHSAHSYTKTFGQYAIIGLFVDANSGGTAADFIITGDGA